MIPSLHRVKNIPPLQLRILVRGSYEDNLKQFNIIIIIHPFLNIDWRYSTVSSTSLHSPPLPSIP